MCSVSWSVLITYLPDFRMVGQTQSCTITWPPWSYITISLFSLVRQHLFLLPTLGRWIPNVRDFVIADRLLPYHLRDPYGHFTYLLIFAIRWVLALVRYLLSFLISIFYLGAPFTIKTYIQLWNKPAFAPHSSELIRTRLNH